MQKRGDQRIYLSPPNAGAEEKEMLNRVLESGWLAPAGTYLDVFEEELGKIYPEKKVLALNSGTSALHLALILSGIAENDQVIVSSFNFVAAANAVRYERAIPVFLDSEPDTWNMDPDLLAEYLENHARPKAVIVTHLYGVPAKIRQLKDVCDLYGVALIEDAAEALGSTYEGVALGSFGNYGILSFNGNKIITTGGGGGLIVPEKDYQRALHLATQANKGTFGYDHDEVGFNYRMSNVLAGIGVGQLRKLNAFVDKKRALFEYYKTNLISDAFEFPPEPVRSVCNRWLSTPLLRAEVVSPLAMVQFLDQKNIESRRLWKPLHLHKAYSDTIFYGKGIGEQIYERGLCLPSGTQLSADDLAYIVAALNELVSKQ